MYWSVVARHMTCISWFCGLEVTCFMCSDGKEPVLLARIIICDLVIAKSYHIIGVSYPKSNPGTNFNTISFHGFDFGAPKILHTCLNEHDL